MSDSEEEVGKGRPPAASRFKPGQSGNRKGRPRGKRATRAEDVVLDQMVTVRENGGERSMRADAAFLLQITSKGLGGDGVMARAALSALENRPSSAKNRTAARQITYALYPDPGDVQSAARTLQIATLLDPYRPTAHLALETWVVEAALVRLGERRLTEEEQKVVIAATRMPHKVRWPTWWTVEWS